ncbi:MAG: GTP 3',8-cyclase MoaA [Deltaproteobacteria bacterium]|nr:GTP 3',8-cyclase MoaA [Deltaproteobacteria bacterium]
MQSKLIDLHGRTIDYFRISITDLCNFRCIYCRPAEGVPLVSHSDILRYEEILRIAKVAKNLGMRKVRITGGEPLVRRGVLDFISRLVSETGLEDVALTTNGSKLQDMALSLRKAGLKRVNISLDTLRRDCFRSITGADELYRVLKGIEASLDVGFDPIKINVVLLKGINERDVPDFARLTIDKPVDVRFIERMPFGAEIPPPNSPDSFSAKDTLKIIESAFGKLNPVERSKLDGPATMFKLDGALGQIGVIDPVSGHFCGKCNRMRLTAKGFLRPCLLNPLEIDVRTFLRTSPDDSQMESFLEAAVLMKPASRFSNIEKIDVGMNTIGG